LVETVDSLSAAAQVVRVLRERGQPFALVPGAGVSSPEVPLSCECEAYFRTKIAELGLPQPARDKPPHVRYPECFGKAHPHPAQRRDFMTGLIRGVEPSAANRQLAALLGVEGLGRIVLTPNFDDHLLRAAHALGRHPVVCDHPNTAYRVNLAGKEIQIVQVHGGHMHYDLCNLPGEIRGRARTRGMRGLVERVLADLSPLVFGYAGWPEDVLMRVLQARLAQGVLPVSLYWFLYRAAEATELPRWLKRHPSVQLVVPGAGRDTLPATEVFEHFARELQASAAPVAPTTMDQATERLASAVGTLGLAEAALGRGEHRKAYELLSSTWERSYRADLTGACRCGGEDGSAPGATGSCGGTQEPSPPQFVYLDTLLQRLYFRTLEDEPWLALLANRLRWTLARIAADRFAADRLAWQVSQVAALHGKALSLRGMGLREEALAVFAELRAFLRGRAESALLVRAARALVAEGVTLYEIGRRTEAHGCWERVSPSDAEVLAQPALGDELARALFNRGLGWMKRGCPDAARLAWAAFAARFGQVLDATDGSQAALSAAGALSAGPVALSLLDRARALLDHRHLPLESSALLAAAAAAPVLAAGSELPTLPLRLHFTYDAGGTLWEVQAEPDRGVNLTVTAAAGRQGDLGAERSPLGRCDYSAESIFCPDGPAAGGESAAAGAAAARAGGASLPALAPGRLVNDGYHTFIYDAGDRQTKRAAERSPVSGTKQVVGGASAMRPQTTSDDPLRGPSPAVELRQAAVAGQPGSEDGTCDPHQLLLEPFVRAGTGAAPVRAAGSWIKGQPLPARFMDRRDGRELAVDATCIAAADGRESTLAAPLHGEAPVLDLRAEAVTWDLDGGSGHCERSLPAGVSQAEDERLATSARPAASAPSLPSAPALPLPGRRDHPVEPVFDLDGPAAAAAMAADGAPQHDAPFQFVEPAAGKVAEQAAIDDGTFDPRRLCLGEEAHEGRRAGHLRLDGNRSHTERAVLRVLAAHRGTYLRRGQVHRQLELADPPTQARVGQILRELVAEGLLQSVDGRALGHPSSAFYTLSPRGFAVSHDLEVAAAGADERAELLRGRAPAISALHRGGRLRPRHVFLAAAA
jgi:tetratricopeptide (TPR) repeat protein